MVLHIPLSLWSITEVWCQLGATCAMIHPPPVPLFWSLFAGIGMNERNSSGASLNAGITTVLAYYEGCARA